jgi:hypothetical protein
MEARKERKEIRKRMIWIASHCTRAAEFDSHKLFVIKIVLIRLSVCPHPNESATSLGRILHELPDVQMQLFKIHLYMSIHPWTSEAKDEARR